MAHIGAGGMAEVYRAWDRREGVWCALKVMNAHYASRPAARQRFIDEGRTVIGLDHRNVISAWDIDASGERPFLVMELAECGSLKDWVDRFGQMPARMAVDVAIQISKGVGAAHRARVVHRDIKPHNILVTRRGLCKVTDFGIAQISREDGTADIPNATLHSQNAMGTLGYMAPEQRTDPHSADIRTDIYGIGATLYTLLTGNVVTNLFIAERETQLLDGIPRELVPILTRATKYRPEERYDSVQELAKALFEVRDALPPDPPNGPPLAHAVPDEAMAPVAAPPHVPQGIRHTAAPVARRSSSLRFSTTGSQPNVERTRPLIVVASVVGLVVALLVINAIVVRSFERRAHESTYFLVKESRRQNWLPDHCKMEGVGVEAMIDRFSEVKDSLGSPVTAGTAGRALVEHLAAVLPGCLQQPMREVDATAMRATSSLRARVQFHEERLEEWRYYATTPCLAACLGLARRPY